MRNRIPMVILAADIGGTHSRFAAFTYEEDGLRLQNSCWLPTASQSSFADLIVQLAQTEMREWLEACTDVVVAVPGPVCNGNASYLPNVSWSLDVSEIHKCFSRNSMAIIHLINDIVAHAFACHTPAMNDAICVQQGVKDPNGVISLIGAGTGLGFCSLVPKDDREYIALPSEAGHQSFPFQDSEEKRYETFLQESSGGKSIDGNTVVSGHGLAKLYEYLTGERLSPQAVSERLTATSSATERFATYYGRAARNYALAVLSTGGLFVTGGIAARNRYLVDHDAFRAEFCASSAHHELLERVPIVLNVNEECGVWGAAYYAVIMAKRRAQSALL